MGKSQLGDMLVDPALFLRGWSVVSWVG